MADLSIPSQPQRSPIETGIDRVWRFFCSVRIAVVEITFLALLVLAGTLRGSEVPQWIADGLPFTQGFVDRWYDWDVFGSPVFAGILALLSVAIAVCTINRVPGIWQTISEPRVRTSAGYLSRAEMAATVPATTDLDETARAAKAALEQRRYRVITERIGDDIHLYADKHRYAKLGTFPFHLALILLLVGGIVGAQYGFREPEFVIPETEFREVGHGTNLRVELIRFRDSYTQVGIAESFEADIAIYDGNDLVKTATISPNHPVTYGATTFYQSGLGYGARMKVTDATGNELYYGTVDVGLYNFAGNPEAPAGYVTIPAAGLVMTVVAPDTNPANQPELDQLQLLNGQMYLQLQPTTGGTFLPQSVVVDQGKPVTVGGLTFTFEREMRWANLQVGSNPGIPIFIIASVLLVGGLVVTFYFPLRRIRAMISPTASGSTLVAVPLAKRDWSGKRDFLVTADLLGRALGASPDIRQPVERDDWERTPKPVT